MVKMPNTQILLLNLFLLSNLMGVSLSRQEDEKGGKSTIHFKTGHEFVAGRTMEYLPDPIFYDTYIPVIYKIPIPKLTEQALTLLWGEAHKCNNSNIAAGHFCPISYHLSKVIKRLGDDMGFWKPYYVNHTSTRRGRLKKRTGFEVICNEISQHFFRSYTSMSQLDSYMRALRVCSRLSFRTNFRKSTENWVADKAVYYKMMESFKSEYFNILPQNGKVDWAVTLTAYTSVHGLLLTNHVMESVRLATAYRICLSGLIPQTFISMEMLTVALREIQDSLASKNYQLVYNNLEQDIEEYYKLSLADCTFSDEYSFIIRILAPIKRTEISHKLVEINTIPFLEELPKESGIPTRLCRLKLSNPKFTLIESSTGLLLDTRCESNELCKTSEVSSVFENDACTTSLLSDDRQLITNTCKFSCFSVSLAALPLIQRVASDTYVVVGSSDTKIDLHCFDIPKDLTPIALKNVGALRIKLPCKCQLLYSNHVSYQTRGVCGTKLVVEHILPYHWSKKLNLNLTVEKEKVKYEEAKVTSTSVKTTTEDEKDQIESSTPSSTTDSYVTTPEFNKDVDDAQIESSLEQQEEELGKHFQRPKHNVVIKKHQEISTGLIIQLCMLWTLVIILLVITLTLGYHVRVLLKWKELQSYKETRVLYRPENTGPENKISQAGSSGTRVAWESFYDLFAVQ